MSPPRRPVLAAVIVLVATAGACARRRPPTGGVTEPASPAYTRLEASRDLDGRVVGPLAADQGATLVVVFASWCHACRNELVAIREVAAQEPRLRVIGVNAYETWGALSDRDRLLAFLAASAPWLRTVPADRRLLGELGGVPKIPSLFLFDDRGRLAHAWRRDRITPPSAGELREAVGAALGRP